MYRCTYLTTSYLFRTKIPPPFHPSKPSATIRVLSDFYPTTWQVYEQPPCLNEGYLQDWSQTICEGRACRLSCFYGISLSKVFFSSWFTEWDQFDRNELTNRDYCKFHSIIEIYIKMLSIGHKLQIDNLSDTKYYRGRS